MTDRLFADCCYGTDLQHPANQSCPQEGLAHQIVTTILDLMEAGGNRHNFVEAVDDILNAGTFSCPICGRDTPHSHTKQEIAEHRGGGSA